MAKTMLARALPPLPSLWLAGGGGLFGRPALWLLLLIIALSLPASGQSGWTRSKKTYFVKLAYSIFQSDQYYNLDGQQVTTSTFNQQSFNFYGEYGITDRLTVIGHFPLLKSNGFETTETVYGIGDLRIEWKYALLKNKKIPLTVSIAPELPTGSKDNFAQSEVNDFDRINLPTGDGEFNVWTTVAGSVSFYPVNAYWSGHVGYNLRTTYNGYEFRDQIKYGMEAGYRIGNKVWVNAVLQVQQSLGSQAGMTDFVRGDGTAFTAYAVGAAYEFIPRWSFTAQYWNYSDLIVDRRNIYSDPTWSFGVFYEIKAR